MTALTDAGSSKVRNAKHRERPAASRMIVQASTLPNCVKYFLNDSAITPVQYYGPRVNKHYDVCTIRRVPVEAADEHFATYTTARIESTRVAREARRTRYSRTWKERALVLASVT